MCNVMEFYIWSSRDAHIQVYSKEDIAMDFKTTWRTEVKSRVSHVLEVKVKGDIISPVLFFFQFNVQRDI